MSKFIIEVRTSGFSKAHQDFNKLNKSAKDYDNTAGKIRGSTSGMRRQIGALRNSLLLATFAFAGIAKGLSSFVRASSGFQDVKTRLTGMFGSVEEATEAFNVFNQIAATTPFMLEDVVNAGAQLEAFGVDSKATLKSVTDLAAYMGSTAVEAANALGRAFAGGAGQADILRNKGILQLVKDSQGIEDLTKLTLPQFRQALISSMFDPAGKIAGSADRMSDTWTGAVSNMNDSISRFQALIGDAMLPSLMDVVKATEKFFRSIDLQTLAQFATSVGVATTALVLYQARAIGAAVVTAALSLNWKKFIGALAVGGIAFATDKLLQMTDAFNGLAKKVQHNTTSQQGLNQATQQYINKLGMVTSMIGVSSDIMEKIRDINKETFLLKLQNNNADEVRIKLVQSVFEAEKTLSDALKDKISINSEAAEQGNFLVTVNEKLTESEQLELDKIEELVEARKISILQAEEEKDTIESNIKAREDKLALMEAEQQAVSAIADANKAIFADNLEFQLFMIKTQADKYLDMKMDEVAVDAWAEQQKLDIVQAHLEKRDAVYNAFMSGYDTFVNSLTDMEMTGKDRREKIWEASKASFVQFLGDLVKEEIKQNAVRSTIAKVGQAETILSAGIVGAALAAEYAVAASLAATASWGLAAETGLAAIGSSVLATQAMAAFAEGGDFVTSGPQMILVGDNPGGKEHVRISPLSSPPGPNAPSSGNITVNISAPLVDETVIDHIIPAIQKAQRMNLA
jgi:hypothetical protein